MRGIGANVAASAACIVMALGSVATEARAGAPGSQNIAGIAVSNGNFTTLVAALSCTNLVGAVANPDVRLTVFAPTDAAFAALGLNAGNVCSAFSTETLTTILLYHVTEGRRQASSVISGRNKEITMLAGGSIFPRGAGSAVLSDNLGRTINIVAANVQASNGVVHVVDNVLLPVAP